MLIKGLAKFLWTVLALGLVLFTVYASWTFQHAAWRYLKQQLTQGITDCGMKSGGKPVSGSAGEM